jgi:hypothetical protein
VRVLGFELPEDYKRFITTYGTGNIDNFLWVLNPFSGNDHMNLITQARVQIDAQRQFAELSGTINPYPLYPEPNALFPWGITDNGDVLYWLRKGAPANWLVVVSDSRASRWRDFPLSTIGFLVGIIMRQIVVDVFPNDFPSSQPEFVPNG